MGKRLAVIGAGPVGLCAALAGVERGFDVTVFERDAVGQGLLGWGNTRLFSPFVMNVSVEARRELGREVPRDDALLTGPEMVERVLAPLAQSPRLAGRIRTGHRVAGVARAGMTRMDFAGHPLRSERPFCLLVATPGAEEFFEADAVLDASGVTGQPCWVGPGGLPARGERALDGRILRSLGSVARRLPEMVGQTVLLAGGGHSAATALLWLEELSIVAPQTRVRWAVRTANRRPVTEVADDPLPERHRVASRSNDLAESPPSWLTVERRATVESLDAQADGGLCVELSGNRSGIFAEIIALTGYRPDWSFLSELQLEVSPSTEGAGRLSRALDGVTDCLSVPAVGPEDLQSGEPGFFLVGAKSYGRSRNFLIRTGLQQLEGVLKTL
jgi:hypothetical protein